MKSLFKKSAVAAAIIAGSVFAGGQSAIASGLATYEVTVTNITNNVIFTPVLAVTHNPGARLFDLGHPASVELEMLAEGGSPQALIDSFDGVRSISRYVVGPGGGSVTEPPLTLSGESNSFRIRARQNARLFSMAAMLLPSNDSFAALDSVRLPKRGSVTYYAKGYDAGTEANDQSCDHIPGGAMCSGEGFNPARDDRGDYVHISSGIHDLHDLTAAAYDWRNPVAEVTIRRIGR